MKLSSTAFADQGRIPSTYTCDGNRLLSPPLTITDVPEGAKSLVLIMDDPDIPKEVKEAKGIDIVDHWVLFNIPPETTEIAEGTSAGTAGVNTRGEPAYNGPCPPPEYSPKEHRYIFVLYALGGMLDLPQGATKQEVLAALAPVKIEEAQLIGRYSRA